MRFTSLLGGTILKIKIMNILTWLLLLLFLTGILIPIVWFILASVQPASVLNSNRPILFFIPTFENYYNVFSKMYFLDFYRNSFIVCGFSTVISVLIGSFAAYSFARYRTKISDHLSFWVLSTRMMPPIAVIIPMYLLMSKFGLLDTYFGLILVYITINIPYVVWMMKSFFTDIPRELDESAMVDGCGRIAMLQKVIFPLAMPGIISTAVFVFILSWSEFLFALLLTSTQTKTLPVAIAAFITDRGIEWGNMSAAGSALVLPLAVMFFFIQKFLVRGLTFGAVKG